MTIKLLHLTLALMVTPLMAVALESTASQKTRSENSSTLDKVTSVESAINATIGGFQSSLDALNTRLTSTEALANRVNRNTSTLYDEVDATNRRIDTIHNNLMAAINAIKPKVNAAIACNEQKKFYTFSGCQTPQLELVTINIPMIGGYSIHADNDTATQWCLHNSYFGLAGFTTKNYKSPGNNKLMHWKTNTFRLFDAGVSNIFIETITCYRIR